MIDTLAQIMLAVSAGCLSVSAACVVVTFMLGALSRWKTVPTRTIEYAVTAGFAGMIAFIAGGILSAMVALGVP